MRAKQIELDNLMLCPVDWDTETLTENWEWSVLHLDWLYCLSQRIAEGSDIPVTPEDYGELFEDERDTSELDALLVNLRQHRKEAKDLYETRGGRLAGFAFLTPSEHKKHFRATLPQDQVVERSRGGAVPFLGGLQQR